MNWYRLSICEERVEGQAKQRLPRLSALGQGAGTRWVAVIPAL